MLPADANISSVRNGHGTSPNVSRDGSHGWSAFSSRFDALLITPQILLCGLFPSFWSPLLCVLCLISEMPLHVTLQLFFFLGLYATVPLALKGERTENHCKKRGNLISGTPSSLPLSLSSSRFRCSLMRPSTLTLFACCVPFSLFCARFFSSSLHLLL